MKALLNHWVEALSSVFPTERQREEAWLAESIDRVDLERRLRMLDQRHQRATGLDVAVLPTRSRASS